MCMKLVNIKVSLWAITIISIASVGLESCSKSSGGGTPPPSLIGGFVSSDSVEPQALVAYWPLDADVNDHKGGITGTGVNVTYVAGIRGEAYQGSTTTYASFTPSSTLQGLQSFSLSLWYWQSAQPLSSPNTPQGIFFMADANTNPDMIVENESYAPVSGDSLELHAGLDFPAAVNYNGFTMQTYDTNAIGKWVHFCMTYNGGTSTYVVYQDGVPMLNSSAYGTTTSTILLDGPTGSTPQGNINWSAAPPVIGTIGTWSPNTYGVSPTLGANGNFAGKLDEIRVFNIAITQTDVAGLYLNGLAGR